MVDPVLDVLILGLGNILCQDDGAGVEAASRLAKRYVIPNSTEVVDGGTLGLRLLPLLQSATRLIILDAVSVDAEAGKLVRFGDQEARAVARERLSVHQVGVGDLLSSAQLLGGNPQEVVLLGVVPKRVGLGVDLSESVTGSIDELVQMAIREAARLGAHLQLRQEGQCPSPVFESR